MVSPQARQTWTVLEQVRAELPHGGDHESRKYIAEQLIQPAEAGQSTLTANRAERGAAGAGCWRAPTQGAPVLDGSLHRSPTTTLSLALLYSSNCDTAS